MTENPYRPGVGLQPAYLAGRDGDIRSFTSVLGSAPGIPGNVRITGLRGVGKTVLLSRFQEVAESNNWATIAVELEPRHCADSAMKSLVENKVLELERKFSLMKRVKSAVGGVVEGARRAVTVSAEGFEWSIAGDLDDRTKSLATSLLAGIDASTGAGKDGLVIFFDEAQILVDDKSPHGDHALSSLIASVSTLQKQGVAISLVLCGLPTLAVNLLTARTYTERMFRGFKVSSLKREDAIEAFIEPLKGSGVTADFGLVERVIADVAGYPYFIQLWGAELWDATTSAELSEMDVRVLEAIEGRIQERLDLDFYEPRVESLTPAEQDLLLASASCAYPPLFVSELNLASPKSNENINVLLGRLVKANVLYRPRKGEYRYTAPNFREYLLRRLASLESEEEEY